MNKKKFKNVFSKTFVIGLAAVALTGMDVNAATVRETAGKEIPNGAYIIGITRFTNDVNITADRVLTAGQNDMFFKGVVGYQKPAIYQYRGGNWIKYDADNNSTLVSASEATTLGLNNQDIYYVNNEPKMLEVAYNREGMNASNLKFTSDAVGATIKYADGVMYVPATTTKIEVKGVVNGSETLLETLSKTNVNENGDFDYRSSSSAYYGSISADEIYSKSSDVTVNGETITIGGTIAWSNGELNHGVDLVTADATKSGHRVGVKITAPNGTNLDTSTLQNIKVYLNGVEADEISWTQSNTGKDSSFWFTPIVESGKTYTVKVVWDKDSGISQTFTIKVTGTLAPMPAGTLSGENIYLEDEKGVATTTVLVSASSNSTDKITFNGTEMPWDDTVTVKVKLNDYYANNSSYNVSGILNNIKTVNLEPTIDQDGYDTVKEIPVSATKSYISKDKEIVISGLKFIDTAIGRTIRVSIPWDTEYTQDFDVVLADSTQFAYPDVRLENVQTLVGYTSGTTPTPAYSNFEEKDGVVTISNTQILWTNDTKGGNRIEFDLVPSTTTNNSGNDKLANASVYTSEELAKLTVRIDGKVVGTTDSEGKFTATTLSDPSLTNGKMVNENILAKSGNETHKIEILWDGTKVVKTYNVNLEGVTLAAAQQGNYYLDGTKYASQLTNDTIYVYMSTFHNVYSEDKTTIIGTERDSIPYVYDVAANAVLMDFTNTSYTTTPKVEINGKVATKVDDEDEDDVLDGYYVPVSKGSVTTVKVYWDDTNVQEFRVAPHATNATFAPVTAGEINVGTTTPTTNDKTTITYSGDINWKKDGSETISIDKEKAEDKHGYTLEDVVIAAPKGVGTVTGTPKVTISGGKYSDDKNAENYAVVTPTVSTKSITPTGGTAYTVSTVTIDPVVTATNQTLTIKVDWNGSYVETYTLKVVGAGLKAVDGVLKATDHAATPLSRYNEVIPYVGTVTDGGETTEINAYVLETTLSGVTDDVAVEKVELDDASETLNEKGEKVPTPLTGLTATGGNYTIPVQFSDDVRTATVKVIYNNGYTQTFTINATQATIPTVNIDSRYTAEKNEATGEYEYNITAKIDDNLGKIVSSILPNTGAVTMTKSNDPVTTNEIVVETDTNGNYVARHIGLSTLTFNVKVDLDGDGTIESNEENLAKPVIVNVTVVNDAVTVDANAAFDGDLLKVSANVGGGTGSAKGYKVKADVYKFDGRLYVATPIKSNVEATKNSNGLYEVSIPVDNSFPADRKVKVIVTAYDGSLESPSDAVDARKNLKAEDVVELPNEVKYTLTFDANGGVPVDSITVGAGEKFKAPTTTRADVTTPNGNVLKYTFEGWYPESEFNEDGTLKSNAVGKVAANEEKTNIDANAKYKAAWSYTRTTPEGKIASTNASGNTVTVPQPIASVKDEEHGEDFTNNISKIKSVDYTGDTITVTFAGDLTSYENGANGTGKWFGVLVDLGIDPNDFVIGADGAHGANYGVELADITDVAKFGGETDGNQFIMWLTTEQVGSTIKEFKFKDGTTVKIKVVEE